MDRVFSQVWYPYTQVPDFEERVRYSEARMPGLGPLKVYMLVKDKADIGKVREAVADNVRRFNQSLNVDGKREFSLLGQPDRHWESIFRYWSNVEPDIVGDLSRYGVIFLLLLLVPAVSLSGMADSRMERRLGELGVRRAFGAPKGALIGQVLMENFLYTLLGGLVGLLSSLDVYKRQGGDYLTLMDRIRRNPSVESICFTTGVHFHYRGSNQYATFRKDSLIRNGFVRYVSPTYCEVFDVKTAQGGSPSELVDALRDNQVVVTGTVADSFFGDPAVSYTHLDVYKRQMRP